MFYNVVNSVNTEHKVRSQTGNRKRGRGHLFEMFTLGRKQFRNYQRPGTRRDTSNRGTER